MIKKQYQTQEQLERTIEEAIWMFDHTPDERGKEQYKLKAITASQDFYVVTGDWYHRIGNKIGGVE